MTDLDLDEIRKNAEKIVATHTSSPGFNPYPTCDRCGDGDSEPAPCIHVFYAEQFLRFCEEVERLRTERENLIATLSATGAEIRSLRMSVESWKQSNSGQLDSELRQVRLERDDALDEIVKEREAGYATRDALEARLSEVVIAGDHLRHSVLTALEIQGAQTERVPVIDEWNAVTEGLQHD